MANKPTPEELKEKEDEAIKAAEELEGKQQIPQDDSITDDIKDSTPADAVIEDETPEETEEVEEPIEEAEPSKELFKKKFSASSRENQKINAKNRVINQGLIKADELPEPTEEELTKVYPDWELMTDIEKGLAKETIISRNWRKVIAESKDQATKIEKWNDSIDEFVDDPKSLIDNPELEGKTDEFREFAIRDENNNVPINTLIGAFLYEHSKNGKSNKGSMFIRAKGGSNEKPQLKNGKISLEDARQLRETNYDLWKEKNSKGLIDYNI